MVRVLATPAVLLLLVGCGSSRPVEPGNDGGEFVPRAERQGGRAVLSIVFPDGTAAELVYPEELDLAGLGVHPYGSGYLRGESPNTLRGDGVGRDFWIFYDDLDEVLVELNKGRRPRLLAKYPGADGRPIGFWEIRGDVPHLGFQFGGWAVLVYDYTDAGAMTDAERASWAASFSGRESTSGFLLLEGEGSLRLARAGEHAGPQLSFGDYSPDAHGVSLFPGRCGPHRDMDTVIAGRRVDRSPGFADWCLSPWMRAHAGGSESFITALIQALEIRDVRLANQPVR